MAIRLQCLLILFSCLTFGQEKPIVFYNEGGEKISREQFIETKDFSKNLDLYFENDTTQIALLIMRQKFGALDKSTFTFLKSYLKDLSNKTIDSTQYIVINYLTPYPERDNNSKTKSGWNVLDRDYLKKLHKIANITQFYINAPDCNNLKYNHSKRIPWISDKQNLFRKLFFPYHVRYGNYILIKPNGKFYYYLGEHSKYEIWENAEKYFK